MRVLLIQPPLNGRSYSLGALEPLGLEVLAASISEHEVQLLDMRFDRRLKRRLESFRPHVVGITACSVEASTAKQALREVKRFDGGIFTVVGGHHATMLPEDFNEPFVDAIVLGHGTETLPELLESLGRGDDLRDVPGLALARDGKLSFTSPRPLIRADQMPRPDRSLTRAYRRKYHSVTERPMALLATALGCPFQCTFCACWKVTQGKYLARSPEDIVDELSSIEEEAVFFADDNSFQNVARAEKIYELIKARGIKKRYTGYARADTIARHPDLIRKWREIGLESLIVGIEAVSDEDLAGFNKKTSIDINDKAVEVLKDNGVINLAHFLIRQDFGEEDFERVFRYVDSRDIWAPFYTILTPLPGTQFFEEKRGELLTEDFDLFDLAHSVLPTKLPIRKFLKLWWRLYARSYSLSRYLRNCCHNLRLRFNRGDCTSKPKVVPPLAILLMGRVGFCLASFKIVRNHLRLAHADSRAGAERPEHDVDHAADRSEKAGPGYLAMKPEAAAAGASASGPPGHLAGEPKAFATGVTFQTEWGDGHQPAANEPT